MKEQDRKRWAHRCYTQLQSKGIDFAEKTIFLCGNNYRKYLMRMFKDAEAPLKELGIGKQLKFYKNHIK